MPAQRVAEFDVWREGFAGSTITAYVAGSTALASLYTDEALTVAADNPQTLASRTIDGRSFGKFAQPLYTAQAYYLDADSINQTGVARPGLSTATGEDLSDGTVKVTGGTVARNLDDHLAQTILAADYGALGPSESAATNTTTITAAIGAAASNLGGRVILPAGTIPITQLTMSARVRLVGQGRSVTTLQSQTQGKVISFVSDTKAGLERLTLDGVDKQTGSFGVHIEAGEEIVLQDVEVKSFEVGIWFAGSQGAQIRDLYVNGCTHNVQAFGDTDEEGSENGTVFQHNTWIGGACDSGSTTGLHLSYVDREVLNNRFADIQFASNAIAIHINGARFTRIDSCWFEANTTNIQIEDDDAVDVKNQVEGVRVVDCTFDSGNVLIEDTALDIVFERCEIEGVTITLTSPDNAIALIDCIEDASVVISGDTTKLARWATIDRGKVVGVTTGNVATKAWAVTLEPGEMAVIKLKATANQRDGENRALYTAEGLVYRNPSDLAYDAQTTNFTLGETLTGSTSGATGLIVADVDAGATGTLSLRNIVGVFQNNETITDGAGGSATANGTLVSQVAAVASQQIEAAFEDIAGMNIALAANVNDIEVQVTGDTGKTFDWTVEVEMMRGG